MFKYAFFEIYKTSKRVAYGGLVFGALIFSSCEKESSGPEPEACGIMEGVVQIDPSPHSISYHLENDIFLEIRLLGESNTWLVLDEDDFSKVGNTGMRQANFRMGGYDCNSGAPLTAFKGVIPGAYSVQFYNGWFFDPNGQVKLGERIINTIGDTPIEIECGKTTHIGTIVLTPE